MDIRKKTVPHRNYIPEFTKGCHEFLYPAFDSLKYADKTDVTLFAAECKKLIIGKSDENRTVETVMKKLYRLGRDKAAYTLYDRTADISSLKDICGENFTAVLAAGICHQNGYCREKCVHIASEFPELLPLLLAMFNDWADEVREAAEASFFKALPCSDIKIAMLAYAEADRLTRRGRLDRNKFSAAVSEMKIYIGNKISENDLSSLCGTECLLSDFGRKERCGIYRTMIRDGLLPKETARNIYDIKKSEKETMGSYIVTYYALETEELFRFLKSKCPQTRAKAAEKLYIKNGLWQGAEELLLDKNRSVREQMIFYFTKSSGLDPRRFYKEKFPYGYAVMGLGECGAPEDENDILPLVYSENAVTASAAVYALSRLTYSKNCNIYYEMIQDARPSVSKAAYKAFMNCRGCVYPKTVYEDILKHRKELMTVKRLVKVMCAQSVWTAMPYLIKLYNFSADDRPTDEYIRERITRAIEASGCYFTGTPETKDAIREALRAEPVPKALYDRINSFLR